jgi:hypothetical protein
MCEPNDRAQLFPRWHFPRKVSADTSLLAPFGLRGIMDSVTIMQMDMDAARAIILVLTENASLYSTATKRAVLEGIFELADDCRDEFAARPDATDYELAQTSLSLVKLFASNALKSGKLEEGLQLVGECFWPISAPSDAY